MQRYKNVIFDLGRVIFDWCPGKVLSKLVAAQPDYPPSIIEITMSKVWQDFDRGLATPNDIADAFSAKYSRDSVHHFIQISLQNFEPIPAGVNLWKRVREQGYKTYILSNLPFEFQRMISDKHPFLHEREGAVFSCDVGAIKPEKAIYEKIISQYCLKPNETIFIDDMEENIVMANALGITGILCQCHESVKNKLCEYGILSE